MLCLKYVYTFRTFFQGFIKSLFIYLFIFCTAKFMFGFYKTLQRYHYQKICACIDSITKYCLKCNIYLIIYSSFLELSVHANDFSAVRKSHCDQITEDNTDTWKHWDDRWGKRGTCDFNTTDTVIAIKKISLLQDFLILCRSDSYVSHVLIVLLWMGCCIYCRLGKIWRMWAPCQY